MFPTVTPALISPSLMLFLSGGTHEHTHKKMNKHTLQLFTIHMASNPHVVILSQWWEHSSSERQVLLFQHFTKITLHTHYTLKFALFYCSLRNNWFKNLKLQQITEVPMKQLDLPHMKASIHWACWVWPRITLAYLHIHGGTHTHTHLCSLVLHQYPAMRVQQLCFLAIIVHMCNLD